MSEHNDGCAACDDREALMAEARRLRTLVKRAEWTTRNAAENVVCAFGCDTEADRWRDQEQHATDCPAFTPDGTVR